MTKPFSKRKRSLKPSTYSWKVWVGIATAVVVVVAGLELTNTTHFFHKQKAVSGTIPATTNVSTNTTSNGTSASDNQSSTSSSSNTSPKSNPPTTTNGAVIAPFGTFVSNHNPSLSNPPTAPTSEQSVCNTTPGASCTITFTMDGVVKTLQAQTADSNGAVFWNWDVKQAGLTEGTWTITATATLGGQSKSTNDSLPLKVSS